MLGQWGNCFVALAANPPQASPQQSSSGCGDPAPAAAAVFILLFGQPWPTECKLHANVDVREAISIGRSIDGCFALASANSSRLRKNRIEEEIAGLGQTKDNLMRGGAHSAAVLFPRKGQMENNHFFLFFAL
jgi:hypothetical protein